MQTKHDDMANEIEKNNQQPLSNSLIKDESLWRQVLRFCFCKIIWDIVAKFAQNEHYSAKSGECLGFFAYLCRETP